MEYGFLYKHAASELDYNHSLCEALWGRLLMSPYPSKKKISCLNWSSKNWGTPNHYSLQRHLGLPVRHSRKQKNQKVESQTDYDATFKGYLGMSVNQIKLAGEKRVKWELPSRVELLQHPSIDPVPSLPVVYAQADNLAPKEARISLSKVSRSRTTRICSAFTPCLSKFFWQKGMMEGKPFRKALTEPNSGSQLFSYGSWRYLFCRFSQYIVKQDRNILIFGA